MPQRPFLAALSAVLLSATSIAATSRAYTVTHDRLVEAAAQAIADEAHVKAAEIKRAESEAEGGRVTELEAPYITYSKIKATVDSRPKKGDAPELRVEITTNKELHTRHKEWEQRVHELVLLKLKARKHGDEAKPTSLPPAAPAK